MDGNALERIVRLATRLFNAPAAAVALLDGDRFLVAARHGCDLEIVPRCGSLPGAALDRGGPSVVPDLAALDPPPPVPLIHGRPLRFYASIPIRGPTGDLAGTLCVGDVVPRRFEEEDVALLEGLAALVSDQLMLEREISEHRELLARLEASERRLQDFAETASDWFWEMDADLRFSWLSESVRTRFGLDPAWHYGKTRLEIAASEADRQVAQRVQELMLRREPFRDFEYCRRSPTGDHWLRISGKPVFDDAGRFLGYRGTGRDVTELLRQRELARAAQERYRRLVDLLPDAVLLLDGQRIVVANHSAARLYGVDAPGRLFGVCPIDFLESEHRPAAEARLRRLLETGEPLPPAEFRLRRSDGTLVDVESSATAIEEDGRRLVLTVLRDITERKAAERARREAEARYRALVELSPDPVVLVENGRFVFANRPAARLFGMEGPEALRGRSIYEFLPNELHAKVRARHATPLQEGESLPPVELEILRPDGLRVEIEAKGSLILEGGRRMLLGVLRDIGERKAAERALREAEERYRTLVELAPVGILLYRDGVYRYANRAAAAILGAEDPEELVGLDPLELVLEPYHELVRTRETRLLAGGAPEPAIEIEMRRLDGRVVSIATRGAVVHGPDGPAIQIVIGDITERKAAERALREAEQRYRTLVELAPIGILVYRDGAYRFANRAAAEILGAPDPASLIGLDPFALIAEPFRAAIRARAERLLTSGGVGPPIEIEMRRLDGETVTVETTSAAIRDRGEPAVQIVMRDVTEQRRAARALEEAEARWRALVELSPEAVLLVREGRYVFANRAAAELYGAADPAELVGRTPADFFLEEFLPLIEERGARLRREGGRVPPLEAKIRRLDGRIVDVETSGAFVLDGGRPTIQTVLRDITERKAIEAELRRLAHHDPLTGLPNRLLFFDRLGQLLALAEREQRRGALLMLDLDGFKAVNDAHGHDAGDALLRGVARRLQRVTRRSDTVARLAGDEFALLLYPIADPAVVERIGERIVRALTTPIRHQGRPLRAGASIGVALFPDDASDAEVLVKIADTALFRAKARGRGGLARLDEPLRLELEQRQSLGAALRAAFARDELVLLWQPRVELASGRATALEALPCWPEAPGGRLLADRLARLAEEAGLALELAERTIRMALDQLGTWEEAGRAPARVGLDLCSSQLAVPDLADRILGQLAARRLPASRLAIEVAEEALPGRQGTAVAATLDRLRGAGVVLLLDRFGRGPTALQPLVEGRFDGVILAEEGLRSARQGGPPAQLLHAVCTLASSLGLEVTALGVASEAERAMLAGLGCRSGQGPLFAEPMPAESLGAWLDGAPPPCACVAPDAPILRREAGRPPS